MSFCYCHASPLLPSALRCSVLSALLTHSKRPIVLLRSRRDEARCLMDWGTRASLGTRASSLLCSDPSVRLSVFYCVYECVSSYTMCSSNYSAENTPHSFGAPSRPQSRWSAAGWKKQETEGKREQFARLGGKFPLFFQLGLLLLWVKLERTTRWNELGPGLSWEKSQWFDCDRGLRAPSHTSLLCPAINYKDQTRQWTCVCHGARASQNRHNQIALCLQVFDIWIAPMLSLLQQLCQIGQWCAPVWTVRSHLDTC